MRVIWALAFLGLSALVGAGTWLYLKRVEGRDKRGGGQVKKAPSSPSGRKKKKGGSTEEIWQVEALERGVIKLPGGRYRMVCRVIAPDYYLLGPEGQDAVETAAASALRQLNTAIQTVVTSTTVDTAAEADLLKARSLELPPRLAQIARERAAYLEARGRDRAETVRQAYLVVTWDAGKEVDMEAAWGEMMARASNLADALAGAKVRLEPLDSAGALDLLAHFLRRGNPLRPSEAVGAGVLETYSVWEKEAG